MLNNRILVGQQATGRKITPSDPLLFYPKSVSFLLSQYHHLPCLHTGNSYQIDTRSGGCQLHTVL